jgi:hypothetical protein
MLKSDILLSWHDDDEKDQSQKCCLKQKWHEFVEKIVDKTNTYQNVCLDHVWKQ